MSEKVSRGTCFSHSKAVAPCLSASLHRSSEQPMQMSRQEQSEGAKPMIYSHWTNREPPFPGAPPPPRQHTCAPIRTQVRQPGSKGVPARACPTRPDSLLARQPMPAPSEENPHSRKKIWRKKFYFRNISLYLRLNSLQLLEPTLPRQASSGGQKTEC